MFELEVHAEFSAAHTIVIRGEREPLHGHNWRVTVIAAGDSLDEDGLVCDFHELEAGVKSIIARFHNRNLNEVAPFTDVNPTAENVARCIGEELKLRMLAGARLKSVAVEEAPGCVARWMARG